MTVNGLNNLRQHLKALPDGKIADEMEPFKLLKQCWHLLSGSSNTSMQLGKLDRVDEFFWNNPQLSFEIKRHGGIAKGSIRSEIYEWRINIDLAQATCELIRFEELYPREPSLDVGPLVEQIAPLILSLKEDNLLKWYPDKSVQVKIGMLIPGGRKRQTVDGRRKRFRKALATRLAASGWMKFKKVPNRYWRPIEGASVVGQATGE